MVKSRNSRAEIRTDLALEERERFPGDGGEIPGVEVYERSAGDRGTRITEVVIRDRNGEEIMRKPAGRYLTIEAPSLAGQEEKEHGAVAGLLAEELRNLLSEHGIRHSVLVAGLGNADATPDSLGPRVMSRLRMTRHLTAEYGDKTCSDGGLLAISGIVPGVTAQTGMETAEILKGIIAETKPEAVLVIDALASRSVHRLGTTIQLSDSGIHPGSGVGNHRCGLTRETLGIPVFALGVPMVIGAAALIHDTVETLIRVLKETGETGGYGEQIEEMDPEEQYLLIREIMEPQMGSMYVTPHNIDARVERISNTISEAIHAAFFR